MNRPNRSGQIARAFFQRPFAVYPLSRGDDGQGGATRVYPGSPAQSFNGKRESATIKDAERVGRAVPASMYRLYTPPAIMLEEKDRVVDLDESITLTVIGQVRPSLLWYRCYICEELQGGE